MLPIQLWSSHRVCYKNNLLFKAMRYRYRRNGREGVLCSSGWSRSISLFQESLLKGDRRDKIRVFVLSKISHMEPSLSTYSLASPWKEAKELKVTRNKQQFSKSYQEMTELHGEFPSNWIFWRSNYKRGNLRMVILSFTSLLLVAVASLALRGRPHLGIRKRVFDWKLGIRKSLLVDIILDPCLLVDMGVSNNRGGPPKSSICS